MRYYALYDDSNALIAIGTGEAGTEITESEYHSLLSEIREKARLDNSLYNGEITIEDVPEAWRDEIQRWVDERIAAEASAEATEEDFISVLSELGVKFNEEN